MELERPLIRLNGQEPLWRAIQPTFPFFPPHSACTTSRRCRLPLLAFDTLGQALMSSRSVQILLLDVSDRVPPDFSRMAESR